MELPERNRELDELFREGHVPLMSDFNGEYYVQMLTRLPSLRRFAHRKTFSVENGQASGCNILFSDMRWGYFHLEQGVCEVLDSIPVVVINYGEARNSFITRRIRDHVRCIEKGTLYLGRFNLIMFGIPRFLGYFSLLKKR